MIQRKPLPLKEDLRPKVEVHPCRSLADALAADPTLKHRLEQAGRWTKAESVWAFGSVPTSMDSTTQHPWRAEQEAAIQEIRATAQGTKCTKAGP